MDRGAWWATIHGVTKSQTGLSDFTFTFHFCALEKEMATHSSVFAWGIPGKGEPDGLPSMVLHSRKQLSSSSSRGGGAGRREVGVLIKGHHSYGDRLFHILTVVVDTRTYSCDKIM